ncbi:MAG TPA: M56 family metallopeptidase [Blastocatellia bacterium]|nr:M56 family metallopeptidase [Blastocatellia bacterium]
MSFHQQWYEWSAWLWPLLLNHLWQATLFALAAGLAVLLLQKQRAQTRYLVWWLALTKFALPSALLAWAAQKIRWFWPRAPLAESANTERLLRLIEPIANNIALEPLTDEGHAEWVCVLTALWLLGAVLLLLRWGWRRKRFVGTLHTESITTTGREFSSLQQARAALRVRRRIRLIVSARVQEPGVIGIGRPVVLLPQGLCAQLSKAELDAVMMHEVMHVRRWDNLLSLLQLVIGSVFWFHPLLWWLDRRLLAEREFACDEGVIRCGNAPHIYAANLWKIVQFGNGWAVAGTSRAMGSNLPRRIENMLNANLQNKMSIRQRAAVWGMITALSLGAIAIAFYTRSHTQAQTTDRAVESAAPLPASKARIVSIIKPADFPRLKAEAKGKVLVVNFWATWCPPCLKEIPEFARLDKEYRNRGVYVVTISMDEKARWETKVLPFLKKQNAEFQSFLLDSTNSQEMMEAVDKNWSGSLPATYVFDKAGNVVLAKQGVIQRGELVKNVMRALK